MVSVVINTREDLDVLDGTPEHDAFMKTLEGSLYRLEKDDEAKVWKAVKDESVVKRFGFTAKNFPDAVAPELPEYVAPPPEGPQTVSMRQARLALLNAGLLTVVTDAIAAMPGTEGEAARIEWGYAQNVERYAPLVKSMASALPLTEEQIDNLFVEAAKL